MGGKESKDAPPPPQGGSSQAPANGGQPSSSSSMLTSSAPKATNKVQIAVSVLGGMPGATAYHSSIVVNDEEYFFSDGGIASTKGLQSHKNPQNPNSVPEVIDMGFSRYSGTSLKNALEKHFLPGTYDLLRKNCNSFTDTALFYLLHQRIDKKYRSLELLGAKYPNLVTQVSGGQYTPNPKAADFDVEKLCQDIDPDKVWTTPGQATGGVTANSAEAMRAARLARFNTPAAAPPGGASGGYPPTAGSESK
eukprot:gnl/TRDRNA2_/TRDRNA2_187990_c0_seq1.p1 gnl/TRDRNA2_/TRDRNA2_187990_c0~~gnl/TRDRNA2_/TRDRNA2_187990_c0_seq1.p1  ORF type:complete len:281 (+),score=52.49 gnl/TRDRNA2_/TRDRNA2_187990_c0_seq1:96-845(+)